MKHQSDLNNHAIVPQVVGLLKKSSNLLDNCKLSCRKSLTFSIFLILFLTFVYLDTLHASWYDQKLEGWYYFEDQQSPAEKPPLSHEEAEEFLDAEKHKLKQLLSLAIVSPTKDNVENYIRHQRRWIQQSNTFAQSWGKILLDHPELGEFLNTPTSSYGILAKKAHDLKRRVELLQTLSKNYFLLLFFKGQDPLAQKVAEVAQLFAATNGWKYRAVSLDGVGLSQLKEFEVDKGLSQTFRVQASPSLFIVNPTENQAYPVGAGLISVSELEANIETQLGDHHE
jgi:conjugal transfer pilus assembly protein TraF